MHFLTLVTVLTAAVLVAATPLHKRALGGVSRFFLRSTHTHTHTC